MDFTEIWCAVRELLARHLTRVWAGVQLHVRTCISLFCISEVAGWIVLKFCMRLEAHYISVLQEVPLAKHFTEVNGGVHVQVHTCVHSPFFISGMAGQIVLKIGV